MVCSVRIWCVSREAWRTGSPFIRRSARQRACGFLRARCTSFPAASPHSRGGPLRGVRHQDTSGRLLPPYLPAYLHPRSWLSSCLSPPVFYAGCATDRGTRRFTTSLPASTGSPRSGTRLFAGGCRGIELLTPLSPARVDAPPSQAIHVPTFEPRPPTPRSVKRRGKETIRSAFLRWDVRATGRFVDPVPHLAAWALVKRSRGGPTYRSLSRRERRGGHLSAHVLGTHPRPSPRLPPVLFTACAARNSCGFSGLRLLHRSLQRNVFDARARSASRESSSARGVCPGPRSPRRTVARPVEDASAVRLRVGTGARATSFSLAWCFAPGSSCAGSVLTGAGAAGEGREMTPRSHAVCHFSPRPPRGGVAAHAARTVRSVASASVEKGSPGHCCSGQHGPSTAE